MKKNARPNALPPPVSVPGRFVRYLMLVACLVFAAGATWAFMEFVVWNRLPSELVGKWVVVEGEQQGATLDFHRNGKMIGRFDNRGNLSIVDAQVAVEGDTLWVTTFHPTTKVEMKKKQIIQTLDAKELVLQDQKKRVLRLERTH